MEQDPFQRLKPYVLLSSLHKELNDFRRLGMQHDLFVCAYTAFYGQFLQ